MFLSLQTHVPTSTFGYIQADLTVSHVRVDGHQAQYHFIIICEQQQHFNRYGHCLK